MIELFLNDRYSCDGRIQKKKVNCEYWSVDDKLCVTGCELKKINPKELDCFKCQERKPLQNITISAPKITSQKIKGYIGAETSQFLHGRVDEDVYTYRKNICLNCDRRENNSPESESIGWCTACGCGSSKRAALSSKLYMPTVSCPIGKFETSRGSGFNIKDAKNAITGVAESIQQIIKSDKDK